MFEYDSVPVFEYERCSNTTVFEHAVSPEKNSRDVEKILTHHLQLSDPFREGDGHDLVALQADHLAEIAGGYQVYCRDPKPGSQNAIESGRGAAALQMTQNRDPGFVASPLSISSPTRCPTPPSFRWPNSSLPCDETT